MEPRRGCISLLLPCLALLLGLSGLCGCSTTEFTDPRSLTAGEISGTYRSTDPAGALGILQLTLLRVESSRVYGAELHGNNPELFGTSEGVGTLAQNHLVLNFDRGLETDFYFEGTLSETEAGLTLLGEFIFPDQTETLQTEFVLLDS